MYSDDVAIVPAYEAVGICDECSMIEAGRLSGHSLIHLLAIGLQPGGTVDPLPQCRRHPGVA